MKYIDPKSLTIITTYSCTAACKGCCFGCSPKRKEKLSFVEIKNIIDDFLKEFPSIEVIIFTGGEPFLLGDDLLKAVKYASSLHKMSRIVSNAYWAKNYKTAYCMLRKYKESGLCEINYSTGDSHQEYVPYDNIVFACRAALDLSLSTGVNVETHECKKFHTKTLQSDVRLLKYETRKNFWIKSGLWIPNDSESNLNPRKNQFTQMNVKESGCDTLFRNVTISPNKILFSCCGFNIDENVFLQFGKYGREDLKKAYLSQFDDLLKLWLFVSGPIVIAKFLNKYKANQPIELFGKHPCTICKEIYSDPCNIAILKENYSKIFPTVLFEFSFYSNIYHIRKNKSINP
nr:radical SAM protein [Bacteroides intestinalis]